MRPVGETGNTLMNNEWAIYLVLGALVNRQHDFPVITASREFGNKNSKIPCTKLSEKFDNLSPCYLLT